MLFVPILELIYALILFPLTYLPTGTLPGAVASGLQSIISSMYAFNGIFPIDALMTAAALGITLELLMLGYKFILFVIGYVRGVRI